MDKPQKKGPLLMQSWCICYCVAHLEFILWHEGDFCVFDIMMIFLSFYRGAYFTMNGFLLLSELVQLFVIHSFLSLWFM